MHERIRAVTKHIPFRAAASVFTWAASALGADRDGPRWGVSDGIDGLPVMELDRSSPIQRRMYYFPRAYWNRLLGLPFGRFLQRTLAPGNTFIDVGANVGFYTLWAAARVGAGGRVFSFEPEPRTFASLERSVRRNGFTWATPLARALSDRQGELPFYFVSDGSAHSLVPEIPARARRYAGQVNVPVTTLDELVRTGEVGVDRIDLIKIDVEGEEARTVAGMRETLDRTHCPEVWIEVRGPRGSTRAPNTFPAVLRELDARGYAAHFWRDGALVPVGEADVRGREDVLFRRREG
jgi:FkbM family methyltransferase